MKKWLYVGLLVVVVFMWQFIYLYDLTSKPLKTAQEKAISIAKDHYDLTEILEVTYYNGEEPYQVIQAIDHNEQEVILWIPEKEGNEIVWRNREDGLTKQQVIEFAQSELDIKQLKHIRLGIKTDTPVWEITFIDTDNRYSLFYLHFSGETWIENYRLKVT